LVQDKIADTLTACPFHVRPQPNAEWLEKLGIVSVGGCELGEDSDVSQFARLLLQVGPTEPVEKFSFSFRICGQR